MNVLVFICFSWLIVFSFKQVAREATVSLSPAVDSNWILKGLETVSSCFVFKYTHLLTVQWTRNFQYCTQLRFVQYWKFLIHCTVSVCVYLKTKHSQQSLTHKQCPRPGLEPGVHSSESSSLTMRTPCQLPQTHYWPGILFIKMTYNNNSNHYWELIIMYGFQKGYPKIKNPN